jgi:Lsr2
MASRTIVLLEDDVNGSNADKTIEFGIDDTTYAIASATPSPRSCVVLSTATSARRAR